MTKRFRPTPLIVEELEPRILYSADLNPLVADLSHALPAASSTQHLTASAQLNESTQAASQSEVHERHEIVFIDSAVAGYEDLAKEILAGNSDIRSVQVVIIDSSQDGITQISSALNAYQNMDAIHIISHGDPGEMQIGSTSLNNENLLANAVTISNWGTALSDSGDLLLYGCDLAANQAGVDFVNQLGQLTGADVSASKDLTGAESFGGNWSLEYTTGAVESQIAIDASAQANFGGVLATFTVTNTNDFGAGSLRQAIINANAAAGADTINFNAGAGVATISLTSGLDDITDVVTIDGTTQPGFGGTPIVELNGATAGTTDGLRLLAGASGSTIRGLVINNFDFAGISLQATTNVTIEGNYLGTDPTGTLARPNGTFGILVDAGSSANTIGGTAAGARNVISGNDDSGILIVSSTNNNILGNFIGVTATGNASLGNVFAGVWLENASGNTVGGTAAGAANVISGNAADGIEINASNNNTVLGNFIGLNAAGTAVLNNGDSGIWLHNFSDNNTIGGAAAGARNVISGNFIDGITMQSSSSNFVLGNFIGTNAAGTASLANSRTGISIESSSDSNTIGGTAAGEANVISGNAVDGIELDASNANIIVGNYIGLNAAGNGGIGNGVAGVWLHNGSSNNTIGGIAAGTRNVISGNSDDGIELQGSSGNTILGNFIGLNAAGTAALGNGVSGIWLHSASNNNTIGGPVAGSANVISGNADFGVEIDGSTGNSVLGNLIGLNPAGTSAIGNGESGIGLLNGSDNNAIGDGTVAGRNVISGNLDSGIHIDDSDSNVIQGNFIGTNITGSSAIANGNEGIAILTGSLNNVIGGTAAGQRNVISGNADNGINIVASTGTTIVGNFIGVNSSGNAALPNAEDGIDLSAADSTTIGGTAGGERNVISGNGDDGIIVAASTGVSIVGNFIGVNALGSAALANGDDGINVQNNANNTTIGGTAAGARNVISGNTDNGILIDGSAGTNILGNYIGLNAAGSSAVANGNGGIRLQNAANSTTIGGTVTGAANVISGNTANGIDIDGATSNSILGNFIGLGASGTSAIANGATGVWLHNGSNNNTIGGAAAGARNVISGNLTDGIGIDASSGNNVLGNFIGLNAAGNAAIQNGSSGLWIHNAANNNTIGGTASGSENVISGNSSFGIAIDASTGNSILGNFVGLNAAGTSAIGNGNGGIQIQNSSDNTTVGGSAAGAENVVSGNGGNGVAIENSDNAIILGNLIGTNAAGTGAVGNLAQGVRIVNTSNNTTVGGTAAGAGNVVSGNGDSGIGIDNATNTTILGNSIGTNAAGSAALANAGDGISVVNANTTVIGGTVSGSKNIISGNGSNGIAIGNSVSTSILGNCIGTNSAGSAAIGNVAQGVRIANGSNNTIVGGAAAGAGNVISGNGNSGIGIDGSTNTTILGNCIGTNASGTVALANGGDGINISNASNTTVIGGAAAGSRNIISGNASNGILISNSITTSILGNCIGTNAAGNTAIGNTSQGIRIANTSNNTTIGGTAAGADNVISGNGSDGIGISNSTNTTILGNLIGTNAAGSAGLNNGGDGINIVNASATTIGGTAAGSRNLISGNSGAGVSLDASNNNTILGNYIGLDAAGVAAIANVSHGIFLQNNSSNNVIGGTAAGAGNRIANNGGSGIRINTGVQNPLLGNEIFQNGGLGIDLGGAGVTPNDIGDADAGANNSQNFIAISGATKNGTQLTILGTFNSTASTNYRIEFFANPSADPSGFGEGERYLGFINVTTDGAGNVNINSTFVANVAAGEFISATATDLTTNDTSEFCAAVVVNVPGFTVTPVSGLTTTEDGGQATFQVVLNAIPTSNVTINVASADTTEGTVSPTTLTFTSANWNVAQTVTLTGVQDFVTDGDIAYSIILSPASSADLNYNGLDPADVSATNTEGPNDPPVNSVPAAQTTNEDTALIFSVGNGNAITVSDVDATDLHVTLTVTSGTLTLAQTTGLVFTTGTGTAESTMTFIGTIADVNTAMDGLRFDPAANFNGAVTLTIALNDLGASGSGGSQFDSDSVAITVAAVNDAPINAVPAAQTTNEDTALIFSVGNSNAITVSDVDAANLQVTLAVTNGTLTLAQTTGLAFTSGSGAADTSMTFTGSIANINAALNGLRFDPMASFNGGANLTITSGDLGATGVGGAQSDVDSVAITVAAVNDAPVNVVPAAQTTNEDTALIFSIGNGNAITVSDVDAANLQVTLAVTNGTLTLAQTTGLTFASGSGTADSSMTFTGSIANINAAIDGLRFDPTANFNGGANLTVTSNDQGATGLGGPQSDTDSVVITVVAVNDAPVNVVPGAQTTNEDAALIFSVGSGNAITVSDVDAASLQVTLAVTNGTLTLVQTTGLSFTSGSGTADISMTFTGSIANINAALNGLRFDPTANFNGGANLTITADDLGATGLGGAQSDVDSVAITVAPVNDAPANVVPAAQTTNEDTALIFSGGNGNAIAVSDVDAASLQVTLAVSDGTMTLTQTTGLAFTSGSGTADTSMTFTGSIANINAALNGLRFDPTTNFNGGANLTITSGDLGATGLGGAQSDVDSVAITVAAVNDAPVNVVPAAQTTNEDTALIFSVGNGNAITTSDIEAASLQITLAVSNGALTLAQTTGITFTSGSGTGDTSMTFTGSIADINAALDGLRFDPAANFNGGTNLTITSNDLGVTGLGGAQVTVSNVAINVTAVNDAPVNAVPGPQTTNDVLPVVFSAVTGNAITVSDPDAAILQITLSATNGTLTLARTTGLKFSAGSGNDNASMIFTGSITNINAALNGLRFTPGSSSGGSATLTLTTSDLGATGIGGTQQAVSSVLVTIDPSFVPPQVSLPPAVDNASTLPLFNSSDLPPATSPDSGSNDENTESGGASGARKGRNVSSGPLSGFRVGNGGLSELGDGASLTAPVTSTIQGSGRFSSYGWQDEGGQGGNRQGAFRFNELDQTLRDMMRKFGPLTAGSRSSLSDFGNAFEVGPASMEKRTFEYFGMMSTKSIVVSGAAVSLGTVWLVVRKGTLIASLLASMPAWQRMDPLPIITNPEEEDKQKKQGKSKKEADKRDMADHIFGGASKSTAAELEERR